ncbi:MAG: hypothetical protein CM1200mP39_07780 [Dehalococcoidia bacterium]|nr:MAG: hypothetical protein CM1200mP39_07780 [Dehalococcoidia bacterium]
MLSAIVLVMVSAVLTKPVSSGSFPGTNGKIVFTSSRDGNKEIYVMDADGSNQTRLTNDSAVDENPSWSADGNKIVFQSNAPDPANFHNGFGRVKSNKPQ